VVDDKGTPLEADYRQYSGDVRRLLKMIERAAGRNSLDIDWQDAVGRVDLSENDFLLEQLKENGSLVDSDLRPLLFSDATASLKVLIAGEGQLSCRFIVEMPDQRFDDFRIVSEQFVLAGGSLYPISALGDNYMLLPDFRTLIFPAELPKYLSLLLSYFDNIGIEYGRYRLEQGKPLQTRPALVFEKVCADNTLYLRVVDALPGFEPDFIEQYDLSCVVTVDDAGETITVSALKHAGCHELFRQVKGQLNRICRQLELVGSGFHEEDNLFVIEAEPAERFVYERLPALAADCLVFGAEDLKSYRVRTAKPEIRLSLNHGIDFLEGEVELGFGEEVFSLFEVLYQYRKNAYVQLSDGNRALLDPAFLGRLERIFQHRRSSERISFFDLPLVEELIGEKLASESFVKAREVFEGFNHIQEMTIALPSLEAELRPYQTDGFRWLSYLHQQRLGGCLADDMGLGKTLQAIALLSSIYPAESEPSLVIIPRSLIFNWQSEFRRFSPSLAVHTYYGPDRDLETALHRSIIITTYGVVRSDIEVLREQRFHYVILDESQQIKNINSQISKAVMALQSVNRLALSGTPIENNLGELYALFRFLNPAMFGGLERFYRHYLGPIQNLGDEAVSLELKRKIRPFILRRLKRDVLSDLPEKIEQVLYVEPAPEQKRMYEQRRRYLRESVLRQVETEGVEKSQFQVLQAITDLRQIASVPEARSDGLVVSSKRERLMEQLLDALANDHKALIFANFLSILDFLADDLNREQVDFELMTGATRNRSQRVRRFQEDPACRVFLMTLKTGGLGLNLTAADTVFIYDPWWNVAVENQAVDRSHRIGQDRTVFSYKLITRGTIEERIMTLQLRKQALFDSIIGQEGIAPGFLEAEDIDFLLGADEQVGE